MTVNQVQMSRACMGSWILFVKAASEPFDVVTMGADVTISRLHGWLRLGHIQRRQPYLPIVQRFQQRLLIQQTTSGNVDQMQPRLGTAQHITVHDMPRGLGQRRCPARWSPGAVEQPLRIKVDA